ncbi:MAG: isoprenylcysteine carboxylmethyltransferase family protein [Bryobacteraceae bacterium]
MKTVSMRMWLRSSTVAVVMGLLLFVPASTIDYWQAWAYFGIFVGASLSITLYLMRKDPALLKRREEGGPLAEKRAPQKIAMLFVSVGFTAALIVPALDHRFGWSHVRPNATVAGDVLVALSFYIIFLVSKENTFASARIEVSQDQRVISSGPYALVRHPMYVGLLLLFFGTPLALGSYWGLLTFALTLPGIIWRLFDEETLLAGNLPGYTEYCRKVRWRLIPAIF